MKSIKSAILIVSLAVPTMAAKPCCSALLTQADKELWGVCIKRVKMKPPCCGACKWMTLDDAKAIWEYLTSNSPEKKRDKNFQIWLLYKKQLLAEFKTLNLHRYEVLYGAKEKGGNQK